MTQLYDNAYVILDGKPIGSPTEAARVETHAKRDDGPALRAEHRASYECTVPLQEWDSLAALFHREPAGASAATLSRRAAYGGRKGRRAYRRLLERASPVELELAMPCGALRVRGRCVMVGDEVVVHVGRRRR